MRAGVGVASMLRSQLLYRFRLPAGEREPELNVTPNPSSHLAFTSAITLLQIARVPATRRRPHVAVALRAQAHAGRANGAARG